MVFAIALAVPGHIEPWHPSCNSIKRACPRVSFRSHSPKRPSVAQMCPSQVCRKRHTPQLVGVRACRHHNILLARLWH
jgi:hypothetical protein